jgi:hypothetical protein
MTQEPQPQEDSVEFSPERWELAIEDAAELVALVLDRGQALYSEIEGFSRRRPLLTATVGAVAAGAVVGLVFASARMRRRTEQANVVAQASAVAQAAAQRLAQQPSALLSFRKPGETVGIDGQTGKRIAETRRAAQDVMKLVPVVVAVLKNPFVRRMLWRYARAATRRNR